MLNKIKSRQTIIKEMFANNITYITRYYQAYSSFGLVVIHVLAKCLLALQLTVSCERDDKYEGASKC